MAGGAVVLVVWGVVAHDSGAGWVQAVGALAAGLVVVGLVGPAVAVTRARCRLVAAPADAVAGHPLTLEGTTSGALEVQAVQPPGRAALSGASRRVQLEIRPAHRGLLDHCTVVLASAAPFGLVWWTRRVVLALPRVVTVAPATGAPDPSLVVGLPWQEGAGGSLEDREGAYRGSRPYRIGDPRHLVHWPATAHTGELMVRESERVGSHWVTVRAVLPPDLAGAEEVAGRAMGTVGQLLASGQQVQLVTVEPGGPLRAPVASLAEAGRRLARALPRSHEGAA